MSLVFNERLRSLLAPPQYVALSLSGIDLGTGGVKAVRLAEGAYGLTLANHFEASLPPGAFTDGEIIDHDAVIEALVRVAEATGISSAYVSLPESKSHLFETTRDSALEHESIIDAIVSVFARAKIEVRGLENETVAAARAVLPQGDESTVLIIDIGKTTTKLSIITERTPRLTKSIPVGGHALTLAVQKYFGVTETEARRVKAEHGITTSPGEEEYLATMLRVVSLIREEIANLLMQWQGSVARAGSHEFVTRAYVVGGNAAMRGLPEYLESALQMPVTSGDIFINLASRNTWVPILDYSESLSYTTALGLALSEHPSTYVS